MIRSILAVLAGYVAMFVGVMLTTALAMVLLTPTTAYLAANLTGGLLSAIVGGFVAAWIAARSPMGHVWILTAIVAVLAAVMLLASGGQAQGQQPAWYPYALLAVPVVGIPLGGKLRGAYEKR